MFRILIRSLLLILFIGSVALLFNNCGKNKAAPEAARQSEIEIDKSFAESLSSEITAETCLRSETFLCTRRLYSESLPYEQKTPRQECVTIEGQKICPLVAEFSFNTASAKAGCQNCQESFEYEETHCHVTWKDQQGLYSLRETGDDFNQSLSKAIERCRTVVEIRDGLR